MFDLISNRPSFVVQKKRIGTLLLIFSTTFVFGVRPTFVTSLSKLPLSVSVGTSGGPVTLIVLIISIAVERVF